jgi:short-subunit dehydrogenase
MQICLIGASKGIGFALCTKLLEDGHTVWAVSRHIDPLKEFTSKYPDRFHVHAVDISTEHEVTAWAKEIEKSNTPIDALILNASVQEADLKAAYDHDAGKKMLRTNLEGALNCIDAFHPILQKNGRGKILAIASTAALRPSMQSAGYCASKAGLAMAMRSLRMHYGSTPVQFKTAYLGPIQTAMWEGKESLLVPSSKSAAEALVRFLQSDRSTLYYPFLTTTLLRLTLPLPDRFFSYLSKRILH